MKCFPEKQCPVEPYLCIMRKRWTAKEAEDITPALLKFREKRKWAIALRRYVIEKARCPQYAPYFGLDSNSFREWIELQFDSDSTWDTFATAWQFDHIVPVNYFDFNDEEDLKLCWNFINIRVEKVHNKDEGNRIDVIAAKSFFKELFLKTGLPTCKKMIDKIEKIEASQVGLNKAIENFILKLKPGLEKMATFTTEEFEKLNMGMTPEQVAYERDFLKKFK
jgi:hypothetical protein